MTIQFNLNKIIKQFFKKYPDYLSLGENLVNIIKTLLMEKGINFMSVEYRIKNIEQFTEKIQRKKYKAPFEEMEDICGIRIICYFQSDVVKIGKILKNEFNIIDHFNKQELSDPLKFGYRSSHLILKINDTWKKIYPYRSLVNLKAEVQIRTILMHAWAEIEHKLAYKKIKHTPKQFRRKFARISAKLEEADEQFEELINDISKYQQKILIQAKKNEMFNKKTLLNLDTLQSFLNYYLPHHQKDIKETRNFLDKMLKNEINIEKLTTIFETAMKAGELEEKSLSQIEKTKNILYKKKPKKKK